MKAFVKDKGHADTYDDLTINYIKGHNPDLVIFDDESGEETERIHLNELSTEEIHTLVQNKGISRRLAETCENPDGCGDEGNADPSAPAPPPASPA